MGCHLQIIYVVFESIWQHTKKKPCHTMHFFCVEKKGVVTHPPTNQHSHTNTKWNQTFSTRQLIEPINMLKIALAASNHKSMHESSLHRLKTRYKPPSSAGRYVLIPQYSNNPTLSTADLILSRMSLPDRCCTSVILQLLRIKKRISVQKTAKTDNTASNAPSLQILSVASTAYCDKESRQRGFSEHWTRQQNLFQWRTFQGCKGCRP
jgi:hypothetical protein